MPETFAGQISALTCLIVCVLALAKGETPERLAAAALLLGTATIVVFQDRVAWLDPQRRLLAIDGALLVVFTGLTFVHRRFWLIPATAAQGVTCSLHFLILQRSKILSLAYLSAEAVMTYFVLLSLLIGTLHLDRRRTLILSGLAHDEADRLIALHGCEHAYNAAFRLWEREPATRQAALERVLVIIKTRCRRAYGGDLVKRRGRERPDTPLA